MAKVVEGKRLADPSIELDPIPKDITGKVNRKAVFEKNIRHPWEVTAQRFWKKSFAHLFMREDRPATPRSITEHIWHRHIQILHECGVLIDARERGATPNVTIFAVHKTALKARAIANCINANSWFHPTISPNLPSIPFLIRMAGNFNMPYYFSVDLRHWFYQIPMPDHLRPYFRVHSRRADNTIRESILACLPMGFSWSPFIAQCIVWRLILSAARKNLVI
jgi:hypothetical protein